MKKKTYKAGQLLAPFAGIYWRTRYMLLKYYSHRVLSASHLELIETIQHLLEGGRVPTEELTKIMQKADKIHDWHGFKKGGDKCR